MKLIYIKSCYLFPKLKCPSQRTLGSFCLFRRLLDSEKCTKYRKKIFWTLSFEDSSSEADLGQPPGQKCVGNIKGFQEPAHSS